MQNFEFRNKKEGFLMEKKRKKKFRQKIVHVAERWE
jgi:hypothetical protein